MTEYIPSWTAAKILKVAEAELIKACQTQQLKIEGIEDCEYFFNKDYILLLKSLGFLGFTITTHKKEFYHERYTIRKGSSRNPPYYQPDFFYL